MQRAEDTVTFDVDRRHCTDHTGMDAKITGLDAKLEAKATLLMWILSGVGGAILMVLIYNQGRIDSQEKMAAMLQANIINIDKQVAKIEVDITNLQEADHVNRIR